MCIKPYGGNSIKLGRRIKELERIYGIREGRPEKNTNNVQSFTQEDLAKQLGISVRTLQNAKTLTNLPKEIQDLVTGIVVVLEVEMNVEEPMFVKGDMFAKADPEWDKKPDIKWNFTKFVIDREGNVVARFEPTADVKKVEECIKSLL